MSRSPRRGQDSDTRQPHGCHTPHHIWQWSKKAPLKGKFHLHLRELCRIPPAQRLFGKWRTGRRHSHLAGRNHGAFPTVSLPIGPCFFAGSRSEEHTSEIPSLMRTPYAVFFLKKKNNTTKT